MKSTCMLSRTLVLLLAISPGLAAQQQAGDQPPVQTYVPEDGPVQENTEVRVRYWTDRTAIFAGDRITLHIRIHGAAGVDMLAEDLDPARLDLEGLELVDSIQNISQEGDGKIWYIRHTFTTYDLTTPVMTVGEQTLRYYVQRDSAAGAARNPAGEITIAAIPISLRSTLAVEPMRSRLRDTISSEVLSGDTGWIGVAGFWLVLLSGTPVGWWIYTLWRSRTGAAQLRQMEQVSVQQEQGVIDRLARIHATGGADLRQAYDELDRLLREIVSQSTGLRADALTAAEIGTRLAASGATLPAATLREVLGDCEQARYARPAQAPDGSRLGAGVELARSLLSAR